MNENKKVDKKLKRLENKRKKLCALIAVTQLNETDKQTKLQNNLCQIVKPTDNDYLTINGNSVSKKLKSDETHSIESTKNAEDISTSTKPTNEVLYLDDVNKELQNQNAETLKIVEQTIFSKRHKPKLTMKTSGNQSSLSTYVNDRVPILITDIQHLLLNSTFGHKSPYLPLRWCSLEKSNHVSHSVGIIVENVSLYDFCTWESAFEFKEKLQHQLEVITPALYNGSIIDELALVPISDLEKEVLVKTYGSMDAAMESRKDLMVMMRAVFPVKDGLRPNLSTDKIQDNFSRTQLVLSAWQLIEDNYPLPLQGKLKTSYVDYVMTKDVYEPVTANSPMFGIDCEMCQTVEGLELTRVSLVNEEYEVVYETYVSPFNKITNFLTRYSGITESILENVHVRLKDVQNKLREILPSDAILVGQSLNFDLHALKMMHPYIIDTSVVFNTTGVRTRKTKLKHLAKQFLKKNIQVGDKGHCSVEDATTSLKLVKLKLSKHLAYGDAILNGKKNVEEYDHLKKKSKEYVSNIFNQVVPKNKSCLIIGSETVTEKYRKYLGKIDKNAVSEKIKVVSENENVNIVDGVCEASKDYSLTLAHLRSNVSSCNEETFTKLNQWMNKIWTNLESKCLMILILAGNESCNGVAFINIKA